MSFPPFAHRIELLGAEHNRSDFHSGSEPLDRYLKERATQDLKRYVATPFVLYDLEAQRIAGYYTLASTAIELIELPEAIQKKLPRYPLVPAILLGRLAMDEGYQGQGLGAFLLADALRRSLISEIAAMAVVVDAKDEKAATFYKHHRFTSFTSHPQRLYLPMTLIAKQFSSS
ncbi:GNAT family N-acetyltransferase [Merismopedia glauca]|uniref:GNAT family N-acetyltransferase n=1 Tax=Merismopedia glauca CCAP 1448/3 TaxID=1296344 RepID=A0A2T1CAK0_9CYAN|nr:GNAT family N-acetyltransferase [Merismopedia glauca]PSB05274.1 GNAT family N-acetyltransferase [Merismopedia glauca CCAP 1448/3]